MAYVTSMLIAKTLTLYNALALTVGNSSSFALPARTVVLTWQIVLPVAPNAISVVLQVSMDNTNWTTIDTSTATGGEVRTVEIPTSAAFIRTRVDSLTIGSGTTITTTVIGKVAVP